MQTTKIDAADVRAIWKALVQPDMRAVAAKTADQHALLSLHRMRITVQISPMQMNQLRGVLYGFCVTWNNDEFLHRKVKASRKSKHAERGTFNEDVEVTFLNRSANVI